MRIVLTQLPVLSPQCPLNISPLLPVVLSLGSYSQVKVNLVPMLIQCLLQLSGMKIAHGLMIKLNPFSMRPSFVQFGEQLMDVELSVLLVRKPNKSIVPRLGPPTNLRKGGPHKGIKDLTRSEQERKVFKEEQY